MYFLIDLLQLLPSWSGCVILRFKGDNAEFKWRCRNELNLELNRIKGHYLFLFKFIRRNKDDNLIDEFRKSISDCQTLSAWLIDVEQRVESTCSRCIVNQNLPNLN